MIFKEMITVDRKFITPVFNAVTGSYDDSKLIDEQLLTTNDCRPIIAQMWCECGYTYLTYFFSSEGLESANKEDLFNYLVHNGFKLTREYRYSMLSFVDVIGNKCWSFTITIAESTD